ncbi:ATP-binding protein [Granulicella cerasi]|uniref:histidine kinase n=1 Tax=Granulicella cerasi TaxID=741063 RepID=A0ABW1Z9D3_9BACT|nr:PAS domain-containing sensor histidine kinase [Granulicella cerasi]
MSLVVRIIAPTGRDADLIASLLHESGIEAEPSHTVETILRESSAHDIGPLLLAEEALSATAIERLGALIREQPAWSDLPILILTGGGRETHQSRRFMEERLPLGVPVLLERPIRTATLLSSVKAAIRARQRQYQVRDALQARDAAVEELRSEQEALRSILADLRRSEDRFRRLIELSSVGVNIGDFDGSISYANPALLNLLGYTATDVANGAFRWDALTPPEFAEADRDALEQLQTAGVARPYQKAYRAKDGSIVPLLLSATVIPAAEGMRDEIAVFLLDLTSQKQAEAALINSEKLAAVGRLAASISHEINNPLESVTNLLYLMAGQELPPEAREYLKTAEHELARVSQITSQTLRFHRQSTLPRHLTARELLESTLALYHGRLTNANIQLIECDRARSTVFVYDSEMRQVLNNLIGNSIDAMRTGGMLTIRTSDTHLWRTGEAAVRITISDTGHGMSKETLEKIFDAFFTTKGINGTGLGLWISRGIVEKHHARLQVRSSTGGKYCGTTFSLVLPQNSQNLTDRFSRSNEEAR